MSTAAGSAPASSAQPWVPEGAGIDQLRKAALACRGCELWDGPIQTVFSVGPPTARLVMVGEQPGDQEDRQGLPFVGPAGQLLDRALEEVGLARSQTYITNAVKHFRFTQSAPNARRLHKTPDATHIRACSPWLRAELAVVNPDVIAILGATAGRALLGPDFRVTAQRGQLIPFPERSNWADRRAGYFVPTVHPSAVLRADNQDMAYEAFVRDLRIAADVLR